MHPSLSGHLDHLAAELMIVLYYDRAGFPSHDDQNASPRSRGPKLLCT